MTITQKYEVEGDGNEYETLAQAELADFYQGMKDSVYLDTRQRKLLFKAITDAFFLIPIIKVETVTVTENETLSPESVGLNSDEIA